MKREFSAGFVVYSEDAGRLGKPGRRMFLFLVREDGALDMPKGLIEKGESALVAALRESKEEAGLSLERVPSFKTGYSFFKRENGELVRKHVTLFLAKVPVGTRIRISWEHKGYKWLDFNDALKKLYKDEVEAITMANDYIGRIDEMDAINREYSRLPEGRGWSLSKRLVSGEGPLNSEVMVIGQAPGRFEDQSGRPFIGASGKLLDRLLRLAGLKREDVYITSVVQFFPPKNRKPSDEEIRMCVPFLKRQIGVIRPKVVVLLGAVSAGTLAGRGKVMSEHGTFVEKDGITYFVTLHPAAGVRLKKNVPVLEDDFRLLKKRLTGKRTVQ